MLRVPFRNTNIIPKAQSPNIASGQKTVTHSLPHFHLETLAPPLIPPRKIPSLVPNGPPIPYRRRHGQSPHRRRLSSPSGNPPSTMNGMGCRPPFTPSQLEELQHQALIFKHLVTGIPVPPELLLSLRRPPPRFYHHPALGYCTYYGKKLDPEPGRCRRTDGKKWRCSKEAHPDSKYCERHMHRSRSRSRKPVESSPSPSLSQSQSSPSSTVTSLAAPSGFRSVAGSFQSIPLQQQQHSVGGGSSMQSACLGGATASQQLNMDLGCYGTGNKEYRYPYGAKALSDEHSFFSESSGGLGVDSSLDISWGLMPSHVSSPLSNSKVSDNCVLQSVYPQFHSMQDLEQLSKPQQQYSFFGCDYGSTEPVKLGSQSLRPFFDEWPRAKDAWSDLEDERSNRNSFSNTQLAISIPMTSSDLSTTTSTSPNDD